MMDMYSRNQYLKSLRNEYWQANKKDKQKILDEAEKRTNLHRKSLIRKLKPTTNLDKTKSDRKKRAVTYDSQTISALVKVWKIFDHPCGQRLKPLLKDEIDRLRYLGEINVTNRTAEQLKKISSATIDRKLKHQKEVEHLNRKYHQKKYPQLYQLIPIKTDGWAKINPGEEQIDLVEHCGNSASGEFICSLSVVDTATGWWHGQGVMGRGQKRVFSALEHIKEKLPFDWEKIHSDNGTEFINHHLYNYCQNERLEFSRSRPYQKNDNCFVEQKNSTHIRQIFGYLRYDTYQELRIINDLYDNELYLYKNFFQPVMKLKEKIRIKGRIHRRYDQPRTPYQRMIKSKSVDKKTKSELQKTYAQLNPAELKRKIDQKLKLLYKIYQQKKYLISKVEINKKLKPSTVTFLSKSKIDFGNIVK
jgi:hypothetical protein